jgi:hypothetical protein
MAGTMMRTRNINPKYFVDEDLAKCSFPARILFAGLWCAADREGRLEDRPGRLKGVILPYDPFTGEQIDGFLNELARHHIRRYEIDGRKYIQIRNFLRFQKIHPREQQSQIPPEHEPPRRTKEKSRNNPGAPEANQGEPKVNLGEPEASQGAPKARQGDRNIRTFGISGPSEYQDPRDVCSKNEHTSVQPAAADGVSLPSSHQQEPKLKNGQCKGPPEKPIPSVEAYELSNKLLTEIKARDPGAAKSSKDSVGWARDIDLLIRIDGRKPEQIAAIIAWCQTGAGAWWGPNILSGAELRTKFDQLWGQMTRASPSTQDRDEEKLRRARAIHDELQKPSKTGGEANGSVSMAAKPG